MMSGELNLGQLRLLAGQLNELCQELEYEVSISMVAHSLYSFFSCAGRIRGLGGIELMMMMTMLIMIIRRQRRGDRKRGTRPGD